MKEVHENPDQAVEKKEVNGEQIEKNREAALNEIDADLAPDSEKKEIVEERMERNAIADLNDENLFKDNPPREYTYSETELGKSASGQLTLTEGERNLYAQRTVGGEDRHKTDDGGHLIGTRFGGSPEKENIDAQDSNLNRGGYKTLENQWENNLKNGDKVYVNVETYKSNSSDRPDCYSGYYIVEDSSGNRKIETFSYQNENRETQKSWSDTVEENDVDEGYDNPINYNPEDYADELNDNDY